MRLRSAFVALAVCVIAASGPALLGSWIYDDWLMVGHPLLDGLEDVLPAFGRTSTDYQARTHEMPTFVPGATYRPLPMVSFVLVNGTVGTRPLPHHLVSLACHLVIVFLLLRFAAREGRVSGPALVVVTAFALHPANLEAYGWINARSDVLAGLALAGVAALDQREGPARWLWLVPLLLVGALAKETFFVAAGALLVAQRAQPLRPRALAKDIGALVGVAVVTAAVRAALGASPGPASPSELIARQPHLLALATQTLIAPWPRAMRFLGWEMRAPLEATDLAAASLPILAVGLLLLRRQARRALLVLGAIATLAPTALVADHFWLGFDRYLYLPGILIVVAALPAAPRVDSGRWWLGLAAAVALAFGAATFLEARLYRSQEAFSASILEDRPDEPTGYLFAADGALRRGQRDEALAILAKMPVEGLPAAAAHQAAGLLLAAGRPETGAALIEHAAAEHPDDLNLRTDILTLRAAQGRWPEAIALMQELAADPRRRKSLSELVEFWAARGRIPPEVRAELDRALGR